MGFPRPGDKQAAKGSETLEDGRLREASIPEGCECAGHLLPIQEEGGELPQSVSGGMKPFLDLLNELVLIVDSDGHVIDFNQAVESSLGLSRDCLPGLRVLDLIPPDRRGESGLILLDMAKGRRPSGTIPVMVGSGEVIDVEIRSATGCWNGEPAFFAVGSSLSREIPSSPGSFDVQERLELALKGADLGMWDWNVSSGGGYYGRRWVEILGYTLDSPEIDMDLMVSLIHPDDQAQAREALKDHLKGRCPFFQCEYRMRASSGQWKWILAKGRVTERDLGGRALRMSGTYMDITGRKEGELAFRLFRQIIENTKEAVAISDPRGALIYVNPAYEALFGRPFHQAVRLQVQDHYLPESNEVLRREVFPRLLDGESWEGELEAVDALGRQFTLWERVDAIWDSEGQVLYVFGIMHDVSERKEAELRRLDMERRLLVSQKHESLGAMASAVAHHFNNLLMGVLGNLELLQDASVLEARSLAILGQAQKAARRATELSRLLMTYMGHGIGIKAWRDLSKVVADVLPLIESSLPPSVHCSVHLGCHLAPVMADVDALRQVVLNLASNALEALEETGTMLMLSTGLITCDDACLEQTLGDGDLEPGTYAYLEVADDGCGMSPETVARMFDPFFSTKLTGRGLGLASVLGIVRAHHGAVSVRSVAGQGTAVRILFPTARSM